MSAGGELKVRIGNGFQTDNLCITRFVFVCEDRSCLRVKSSGGKTTAENQV